VILSEEWLTAPRLQGSAREPLSLHGLGHTFSCPGLGWSRRPGG